MRPNDTGMTAVTIAIVAGESSGDQLGSRLMREIKASLDPSASAIRFMGVGGPLMLAEGLDSLFPMSDIAVNGVLPVIKRLPLLLRRIQITIRAIAGCKPDVIVLIDAQDFNKRVARALRKRLPQTPIIGYVSPTVWAWRPGRAKAIKPLFNRLMAVLPFEPEVHARLGGPETIYVGHPLVERQADWQASAMERQQAAIQPYRLLVLPGSRHAEINRLLPFYGDAIAILAQRFPDLEVLLPAVEHLAEEIDQKTLNWRIRPQILRGESAKWQAFRTARAALAASGTVTLELAMARVPTVVAYRVSRIEAELGRYLITAKFAALPNVILDRRLVPEIIHDGLDGEILADHLMHLLEEGEARQAQLAGFDEVHSQMAVEGMSPAKRAAAIVMAAVRGGG